MADHIQQESIQIPIDEVTLEGFLTLPTEGRGMVIFAHGSGSGRFARRPA
ncbi:MAG: hypothetical protein AAB360_04280 [Patescibacteria group bacterium]